MQTSAILTFLGFAAMAVAQFGNLPDCAKGCATSSLPANCNLDVKCICSDSSFISGISCCVEKSCSPPDQQMTLQVAQQLCDTVQVKLPSAASCPGGASPSGASSAASSPASSPASSAASSIASSASSVASSTASVASGVSSSAVSGASSMSSTAVSGASSAGAATPPASSTSKAPSASGGAVKELGSKMGAVGAAVAALYLI